MDERSKRAQMERKRRIRRKKQRRRVLISALVEVLILAVLALAFCWDRGLSAKAVSYTHLDVYKRQVSMLLTAVMAVTGMAATATVAHAEGEEGKVINIYSWNDEFRTRLEAIYPEVESTSSDGTVTTLKDGTEIHLSLIHIYCKG